VSRSPQGGVDEEPAVRQRGDEELHHLFEEDRFVSHTNAIPLAPQQAGCLSDDTKQAAE
jgi:hypothetical protein